MASIDPTTTTRTTGTVRAADPYAPAPAGARHPTAGDARVADSGGSKTWMWVVLAAVAVLALLWMLGAFGADVDDAAVVTTTGETAIVTTDEAVAPAAVANETAVEAEAAATSPLLEQTDGNVVTTTVPITPVEN